MMKSKVMNAWTLKEMLAAHYDLLLGTRPTYLAFISDFSSDVAAPSSTAMIESLWQAVVKRYRNELVIITETESTDPVLDGLANDFAEGFVSILELTLPRYSALLTAYADSAAKLLAKVETTTSRTSSTSGSNTATSEGLSKRNDTPQAAGDWTTDPYTSEATKSNASSSGTATGTASESGTSSTDQVTAMRRLQEIQESYRSLLKDWTSEFNGLFSEAQNETFLEE